MASTLLLTVKDARAQADLARFIRATSDPREQCVRLAKYFQRVGAGLELVNFDVQTSSAAPVRASRAVTLTYGSISANDTLTVAGQVLTAKTGTPSTHEFKKETDATKTAANLAALINADSGTKTLVSATSALGVVTITALTPGAVGNFITLASSNGTGMAIAGSATVLASGAGGAETVAVNFSRGL